MKERLSILLKHENLTSSQFADKIGVQRSTVSHVLSDRNKPGFDFIAKILEVFTDINADWLILGRGEMLKTSISPPVRLFDPPKKDNLLFDNEAIKSDEIFDTGFESRENTDKPLAINPGKNIDRIIVLYNDRSFESYHPGS